MAARPDRSVGRPAPEHPAPGRRGVRQTFEFGEIAFSPDQEMVTSVFRLRNEACFEWSPTLFEYDFYRYDIAFNGAPQGQAAMKHTGELRIWEAPPGLRRVCIHGQGLPRAPGRQRRVQAGLHDSRSHAVRAVRRDAGSRRSRRARRDRGPLARAGRMGWSAWQAADRRSGLHGRRVPRPAIRARLDCHGARPRPAVRVRGVYARRRPRSELGRSRSAIQRLPGDSVRRWWGASPGVGLVGRQHRVGSNDDRQLREIVFPGLPNGFYEIVIEPTITLSFLPSPFEPFLFGKTPSRGTFLIHGPFDIKLDMPPLGYTPGEVYASQPSRAFSIARGTPAGCRCTSRFRCSSQTSPRPPKTTCSS